LLLPRRGPTHKLHDFRNDESIKMLIEIAFLINSFRLSKLMPHVIKWDFYCSLGKLRNQTQPWNMTLWITDPRSGHWELFRSNSKSTPKFTASHLCAFFLRWSGLKSLLFAATLIATWDDYRQPGVITRKAWRIKPQGYLEVTNGFLFCVSTDPQKTSAVTMTPSLLCHWD
jgi:hypothetical protein